MQSNLHRLESSESESNDEKNDFLKDTLGIISKKDTEEVKSSKAIGAELD